MKAKEKYLTDILKQLEEFIKLDCGICSKSIENAAMKVYVRQSKRYVLRSSCRGMSSLVIASISVTEKYRRQGFFTDFMIRAHEMNPFEMTYIECISNPLVLQWCRERGWTPDMRNGQDSDEGFKDFYLLKPGNILDITVFTALEASILTKGMESLLAIEQKTSENENADFQQMKDILRKLQRIAQGCADYPGKVVLHEI